ncbi:MAG: CIA30 family protein [Pseudomonadota bacterium]
MPTDRTITPRWVLCLALLACLIAANAASETHTMFDASAEGHSWQIVNDTVMGGRSSSTFDHTDEGFVFSGLLNNNGGGFASVRARAPSGGITGSDAIRLTVLGDGRTYQLRLNSRRHRYNYQHKFATRAGEWQTHTLPLDDFRASWRGRKLDRPAPDPTDVMGFGILLADGRDGPFRIAVDRIEAIQR